MTWPLFILYAAFTAGLALWAGRGNTSASSFAIGSGQMSPWIVGITLGTSIASSATFVLYPGFVFADGLAALVGFSLPLIVGLLTGLVLFAPRFQRIGSDAKALTVPHWLGARYNDPALRRFFAALQVLNVAYLVLIAVGCAYVMQSSLGLPYHLALTGIIVFVFGYTALGGATAHAWTNTLQGIVMLGVSITVFVSGLGQWPAAWDSLVADGWTAPSSRLFSTPGEVWLVPFLMGIALTSQPHLLAKALYVRGRRALAGTVAIGMTTYAIFALMLSAGAYARLILPADTAQDKVVGEYIQIAFSSSPVMGAVITVAILAASMSTLDGLLVAVAASVGNDVFPGRGSVWINRLVLLGLAAATLLISWSPPDLVLILGQLGVYGLVAASVGPLVAGMWLSGPLPRGPVWLAAVVPLLIHFGLALPLLGEPLVSNPGISALLGMAAGVVLAFAPLVLPRPARADLDQAV